MSNPSADPNIPTTAWPFPCAQADWAQTPPAVQAYIAAVHQELAQLKQRVEALEARPHATAATSRRPPSSDSPFRKGRKKRPGTTAGRPGAKPGHQGGGQPWWRPTSTPPLVPPACRGGNPAFAPPAPSYTPQVLALPPIAMDITPWVLPQADCLPCGQRVKAPLPPEYHTGDGPRLSALIGAMAGMPGTSRSLLQTFCASVLGVPSGLGALQKVLDRVTLARPPPDAALARMARHTPVNDIDETPWCCHGTLPGLWGMTRPAAAFYRLDPRRSTAAFLARIDDWDGLLVSEGDGV